MKVTDNSKDKDYINMAIDKAANEAIKPLAEKQKTTLRQYASELLIMHSQKANYLQNLMPHLKIAFVNEGTAAVYDYSKHELRSVTISNDYSVLCKEDASSTCDHARFVQMSPEMGAIWIWFRDNVQSRGNKSK